MKVRTPQFRVTSATFGASNVQATTPLFNITMNTALVVKNTNFGPYKYENPTVNFFYTGTPVGSANIPNSKAFLRSTKNIIVGVNLVRQAGNTELGNDLNSGILPLTCQSTLNGKVDLMFIFKKKKATNLYCTMDVNIATGQL
ncbi:hypothetical protein RHMOL_Rhmol09G0262300 [Rhododendron molle]|uniref:Uncharacterized protein n=1 Tax=Rhododendron molle TaxID=49168 RepID=A0ACC0MIW2_RHOML|nr:hypothetical protein RHMOL_Rhmol09G0262300 [Rhododendron molle]